MSLYKRKTVWWIRFTTPDGRRVRRSTGTGERTQAQEYHDQVKAELRRAGINDFRWHDLRHTWTSWHVQQGTPLHVLQELGGWETVDMVRRHAHLAAEHTTQYAERISRSFAENDHSAGTNLAHAERSHAGELV